MRNGGGIVRSPKSDVRSLKSDEKKFLRQQFLQRRENLESSVIQKESVLISEELLKFLSALTYKNIVFYLPIQGEVDLRFVIQSLLQKAEKAIYLPRFESHQNQYCFSRIFNLETDLVLGKYAVLEPKSTCPTFSMAEAKILMDIWMVPGIVFDSLGHRIGFGKGYYDQFLKDASGLKLGIGYEWQFVENLPVSQTDISMDYLILGSNILKF